jgi:hypothetical protein
VVNDKNTGPYAELKKYINPVRADKEVVMSNGSVGGPVIHFNMTKAFIPKNNLTIYQL